jgi:acyl-ACP thioesterase
MNPYALILKGETMDERFNRNYHIDYMFINEDLTANFINLASKVQETTLLHSLHSGYSMDWFLNRGKGFVLTSYAFKIHRYPKWGENINIATWPSKFRGFIGKRSFKGLDESGGLIIEVDSDWIYMDLVQKKPERVPQDMVDNFGSIYPALFEDKIKIPGEEGFEKVSETALTVRRSDIDSNHHVNNISYIIWAVNAVDNHFYKHNIISAANIKYHRESHFGEELVIDAYKKDNNMLVIIKSTEHEVRCSVYFEFKPSVQTLP